MGGLFRLGGFLGGFGLCLGLGFCLCSGLGGLFGLGFGGGGVAELVLDVVLLEVFAHGFFLAGELGDFAFLVADGLEECVELFVVDAEGILLVDAHQEVGQSVHVVGECLVGRLIGAEVGVCRAVCEVFGRHVVEVVGALEIPPVLLETAVFAQAHTLAGTVELAEGFALELVACPCRYVAGLVGARDGVNDGEGVDGLEL